MIRSLLKQWGPRFFYWGLGPFIVSGLFMALARYIGGLGATTNLSDSYPWGLWISFDILCGVALGAGAFTIAATVYILNLEKYHPLARPAVLTGFIGYLLVIMGLLADLGQPWRIFYLLFYWNPHSPLFEVGWCVMLYTAVLALEVSPLLFERLRMERPVRVIRALTIPLVIAGVVLSTGHQSSLGTLFLIMPDKLNRLWYTPLLPLLFFVSSVAAGLGMVILEAFLSSRALGRKFELDLISDLSKAIPFVLGLYLVLKIGDLLASGELGLMFEGTLYSNLFLTELALGVILPIVLFSFERTRRNRAGLLLGAILVVGGVILNRFDVSLIQLKRFAGPSYFPAWTEFAITIALVSAGVAAYGLVARFLPVFEEPAAQTG